MLAKEGYAYLCWTLSLKYSFVIAYNPEVVAKDILKMAKSVRTKRNKGEGYPFVHENIPFRQK